MHVLVTGGAGFIGSHTVDRLLAMGATVRVLDNLSSGKRENLPRHAGLELVEADIRDAAAVEGAFAGISHVLQLAAQVSVAASIDNPANSGAINVLGFLNVLDGARRHRVQRFVYASSSAVYGRAGGAPVSEATPPRPISPYGLEKTIDDLYAAMYRELYGLSCLGLRYFNVFGKRQDAASPYSGVVSLFMQALHSGEPLTIYGDGRQSRDFICVEDVALANELALQAHCEGVCNVATGQAISLLELTDILSRLAGKPVVRRHLPARPGDIRHSRGDNTRLCAELDMQSFTSIDTGLRRLWDAGSFT